MALSWIFRRTALLRLQVSDVGCGRRVPLQRGTQGRVQGLLPVSQGKVAQLHGQRPEGLLPLLRLRRPWRCDRLRHAVRPAVLHGGDRIAVGPGRHGGSRRPSPRTGSGSSGRNRSMTWSNLAGAFFEAELYRLGGRAARQQYLQGHAAWTARTVSRFRLGFCRDRRWQADQASARPGLPGRDDRGSSGWPAGRMTGATSIPSSATG